MLEFILIYTLLKQRAAFDWAPPPIGDFLGVLANYSDQKIKLNAPIIMLGLKQSFVALGMIAKISL